MNWVELAGVLQLVATMAMLGVIWVVQLCVYPRFADIDPEKFIGAHTRHCAGIGMVVAPLMLIELFTAVFLVWAGSGGWVQWLILIFTLGNFISTALIQAPCHRQLMQGFDEAKCRLLTRSNWIRTVLWSAKALLVFSLTIAPFL
ncbi:MAG: hypothetical protein NWT08_00475 [Akkermansiaceae bacterium]|jgi:hypothetical protein|nr:hypothetical protein [Akkermansiaceae bacterium]MDP4648150.1 hypothetical protein [Akkermansiaceae bacterium]MDP4778922.1 hypothetical protein [Akkermansiaceae bacterium]MDP4898832.1 hypothetical protein [Akkermansiaceae bacterium]MDP4994736.1 hypothetical protein [Akkermansiaceae bacterium]